VNDPYQYGSYEGFLKAHPFDVKTGFKNKCQYNNFKLKETDKNKRYYKNNKNAGQCREQGGIWDPSSINRGNKYSKGTCWITDTEMKCGQNVSNDYLLSKDEVSEGKHEDALESSKRACAAASDKCDWVQNKQRYDCIAKQKASAVIEHGKPVEFPPNTMPIDITDPSKDIQSYIGQWYKSGKAPETSSLEKKIGDQCNPPSSQGNIKKDSVNGAPIYYDLETQYSIEELKKIPRSFHNRAILKRAIGSHRASILEKSSDPANENDVWNIKELYRMDDDIFEKEKKAPVMKSGMTPSIPQSVINMVMKRLSKEPKATARGILGWHGVGTGKCFQLGTKILMYDGTLKNVEDVIVGDQVMGDDSTPRNVLTLGRGTDDMYDIIPVKGEKYTVNSEHILCLKSTLKSSVEYVARQKNLPYKAVYIDSKTIKKVSTSFPTMGEAKAFLAKRPQHEIVLVEVKDYIKLPKNIRADLKGYKTGITKFKSNKTPKMDPWLIGYWLGDGASADTKITTADTEVLDYINSIVPKYNLCVNYISKYDYRLTSVSKRGTGCNVFRNELQKQNLINNKHIPMIYKTGSEAVRLDLLAGLMDSDGHLEKPYNNTFEIVQKSKVLAEDIQFLARSLGFAAYIKPVQKKCHNNGKVGTYYRMHISGDVSRIPTKIKRKRSEPRKHKKDVLVNGITVEHVGRDKFYGFTVDKNHRFVLGDFTVTHNTNTATGVMDAMWDSGRPIIFMSSIDAIAANPPSTFHMGLKNLFPRFSKNTVTQIEAMFEKRGIEFLSFAKAANRLKKTLKVFKELNIDPKRANIDPKRTFVPNASAYIRDTYGVKDEARIKKVLKDARISNWKDFFDIDNSVLIIDEVHNLFRPLAHQKGDHSFLEGHLTGNAHPNMKVVILSATPGDNVRDVLKLLNIVRDPTKAVITAPNPEDKQSIATFKQQLAGMISYLDTSTDVGKFPRLIDNGPAKFPMSDKQFMKYVEAYKEVKKKSTSTNYDALAKGNQLAKWWAPARKYSNMLYSFEKGLDVSELSSKLPALMSRIASFPSEKQYVYSAFYEDRGTSQGVLEIARQLEAQGYSKYDYKEAIKVVKAYKPHVDKPPNGPLEKFMEPAKRFMLVTQKELGDGGPKVGQNLAKLLTIFNSTENKDGKFLQIMVASQGFNEGIDLKAVRHIHIFEPLVTMASDIQTIGRARRFCSHKDLNYEDWTVKVHRYMSDFPLGVDVENTDNMLGSLEGLNNKVAGIEELIKTESDKTIKATLKKEVAQFKKDIVALKKDIREKNKVNTSDIENIDEYVYNESRRRMKELFVVYHAMKEAAIDCSLLHDFHNDNTIVCGL
jgi:hypothetical protein